MMTVVVASNENDRFHSHRNDAVPALWESVLDHDVPSTYPRKPGTHVRDGTQTPPTDDEEDEDDGEDAYLRAMAGLQSHPQEDVEVDTPPHNHMSDTTLTALRFLLAPSEPQTQQAPLQTTPTTTNHPTPTTTRGATAAGNNHRSPTSPARQAPPPHSPHSPNSYNNATSADWRTLDEMEAATNPAAASRAPLILVDSDCHTAQPQRRCRCWMWTMLILVGLLVSVGSVVLVLHHFTDVDLPTDTLPLVQPRGGPQDDGDSNSEDTTTRTTDSMPEQEGDGSTTTLTTATTLAPTAAPTTNNATSTTTTANEPQVETLAAASDQDSDPLLLRQPLIPRAGQIDWDVELEWTGPPDTSASGQQNLGASLAAAESVVAVGNPPSGMVHTYFQSTPDTTSTAPPSWTELTPPLQDTTSSNSGFGGALDLAQVSSTGTNNNPHWVLLVGAPQTGLGHLYVWNGIDTEAWQEQTDKLIAAGASTEENFATTVALGGGGTSANPLRAVVGAPQGGTNLGGRVYIFNLTPTTTTSTATPTYQSSRMNDGVFVGAGPGARFGSAVALSANGNMVVVGEPGLSAFSIFEWRANAFWVRSFRYASASSIDLGTSVTILSQDYVAAGGPSYDNESGVVRIFRRQGFRWVEIAGITGTTAGERLGDAGTMTGRQGMLGGPQLVLATATGTVRRLDWSGSVWVQRFEYHSSNTNAPATAVDVLTDNDSSSYTTLVGFGSLNSVSVFTSLDNNNNNNGTGGATAGEETASVEETTTEQPTVGPTAVPTMGPTMAVTTTTTTTAMDAPTVGLTSESPTPAPTESATAASTGGGVPSTAPPTYIPTPDPTMEPTQSPLDSPTATPAATPQTAIPSTPYPSYFPTEAPQDSSSTSEGAMTTPSPRPTSHPTSSPSPTPTVAPYSNPTTIPTTVPTTLPSPTNSPVALSRWTVQGGPISSPQQTPTTVGGQFGKAVAIAGTHVSISEPGLRVDGSPSNSGYVYTLEQQQNNPAWSVVTSTQQANTLLFGSAIDMAVVSGRLSMLVGASDSLDVGEQANFGSAIYYEWDDANQSFQQVGQPLRPIAVLAEAGGGFGASVALASARKRVAIGAPSSSVDANSVDTGRVYTFEYDGVEWDELTQSIVGPPGSLAGSSLVLNHDGSRLLVGAPGTTSGRGGVFLYEWTPKRPSSSTSELAGGLGEAVNQEYIWKLILPIPGLTVEALGTSVAFLDEAGRIVAFGGPSFGANQGIIRIYAQSEETGFFRRLGSDIIGGVNERIGRTLCGSSSGRLAFGTSTGEFRAYDYDGSTSSWVQVASGASTGPAPIVSMDISDDGNTIVVGLASEQAMIYHLN